ncbi:unnamed protein product, partial [Iphiclides podalirius]
MTTEAKLKEKRETEATAASLHRKIRETISFIEKSQKDQVDLGKRIDKLRCQVQLERINRDALLAQIDASKKELEELKRQSDEGISNVWNLRSSVCNAIQSVSDEYDIWPLLMKPIPVEPLPQIKHMGVKDPVLQDDDRLREALKRRENAILERDRLLKEPDTSEEFIRIKNAVKYSVEKVAKFHNDNTV